MLTPLKKMFDVRYFPTLKKHKYSKSLEGITIIRDRESARPSALARIVALGLALVTTGTLASHGSGAGQSFLFLQPGFTQEIFGVSPHFMGGVAFAPDDDPWVNDCASGSDLHRYDRQGIAPEVSGTKLHPETIVPSNTGCGMANHPDGNIYTNHGGGIIRVNASTGAPLAGPFGPAGNALGITPDPVTGNLVYVGSDGTIFFVDPTFTTSGTFSNVTTGNFVDGIAFDPNGNFLFMANRTSLRLTIVDRTGALIQHVPLSSEPDGISFHADAPKFVVTNNTDGTLTRFDFPGDDFTQVPIQSVFASGGFRGDLSQVGSDGCIYLTQQGTRYDNLVTSGENSLVRICGGFVPPPGVEICGDGIDNDGDGLIDEDCPIEICGDGIDNDGDGLIDEDCPIEICGDGIDNDGDGLIDEGCPPPPSVCSDDDNDDDDDNEDEDECEDEDEDEDKHA